MAEQRDAQIGVKRSLLGLCELIIHSDRRRCMNVLNKFCRQGPTWTLLKLSAGMHTTTL